MSFLLFLVSGLGSTLLDMVLFSGLILLLDKSLAYALSYSICICCRYLFDSRVTFARQAAAGPGNRFLPYFTGNLAVMVFGLGIYNLLALLPLAPAAPLTLTLASQSITLAPDHAAKLLAKVISIPPVTLAGYFLMKLVVFRHKPVA